MFCGGDAEGEFLTLAVCMVSGTAPLPWKGDLAVSSRPPSAQPASAGTIKNDATQNARELIFAVTGCFRQDQ